MIKVRQLRWGALGGHRREFLGEDRSRRDFARANSRIAVPTQSSTWFLILPVLMVLLLTGGGCVRRKLHIRSEPEGAPVWVDEEYVGETPVVFRFSHYGARRLRVGPVRDEKGKTLHRSMETLHPLDAPWYQKFPVDFFFEVLWPGTLVDEHSFDAVLSPPETPEDVGEDQRVREALDEARQYRGESRIPPEEE